MTVIATMLEIDTLRKEIERVESGLETAALKETVARLEGVLSEVTGRLTALENKATEGQGITVITSKKVVPGG